jgi:hypothetical protein
MLALVACAGQARGQTAASPPATNEPSIRVGTQLFLDYTVQNQPKITDVDGNQRTLSQFEVGRAYINIVGNLTKNISFRVTPDVVRETGVGSSLNGSYTFRLKYAYAQWALDDHVSKGSWARFGQQPTPWVGFMDEIYRYRFQGQAFEERDGYLFSSDAGASFRYALPNDYGDVHGGVFNGEGWQRPEVNDQKGWMVRGTARPLGPHGGPLHGLRVHGFIDHDLYAKSDQRRRAIFAATYEHKYVNAGFDYLATKDQAAANVTAVEGRGWSVWVTPRTTKGFEGLLRYDEVEPNTDQSSQKKKRTIGGVAYWFPHQSGITTAIMFDVDNLKFDGFPTTPAFATQRKYAVHALLDF